MEPFTVQSYENYGGLKVVSIDMPFFNIELAIFLFLNLKGHHRLKSINLFQHLMITKISYGKLN
jgi:hypothetical protein